MKVWLFDIDGTLIASGGAGQAATFAAIGQEFGISVRGEGIPFAGRTDRAIAGDVFRANEIPNTPQNWERFRRAYLQQLRQQLAERQGQILAGVRQLLDALGAIQDVHLGLLTGNIQAGAQEKLCHYALWDHFAFGGFGDSHESRDQVAAQALDAAQEFLGHAVRGNDVWVIGDTVHDIRCARAIGANVIAVATGGTDAEMLESEEPDVLLTDLQPSEGLQGVLDAMAS